MKSGWHECFAILVSVDILIEIIGYVFVTNTSIFFGIKISCAKLHFFISGKNKIHYLEPIEMISCVLDEDWSTFCRSTPPSWDKPFLFTEDVFCSTVVVTGFCTGEFEMNTYKYQLYKRQGYCSVFNKFIADFYMHLYQDLCIYKAYF